MLPLHPVRAEMNRLFDELWDGHTPNGGLADAIRVEVRETADHVLVRAEVPGIDPKDLDVQLLGDVLTLSGEKKDERTSDTGPVYSERRYGAFRRAIRLATPIVPEDVRAEHANGVVTITLPKAESSRPRRIDVRST